MNHESEFVVGDYQNHYESDFDSDNESDDDEFLYKYSKNLYKSSSSEEIIDLEESKGADNINFSSNNDLNRFNTIIDNSPVQYSDYEDNVNTSNLFFVF